PSKHETRDSRLDYWEDDGPEDTDESIEFQDSALLHIHK
ncbi:hypothetical protein VP01_4495g2, partial [Puccinia sorghi]